MTPGARIAAAIELMALLLETPAPADRVIGGYFRERRFMGSKDRGYVAELVYDILRRRAWLSWLAAEAGLAAAPRLLVLAAVAESGPGGGADAVAALIGGGDRYGPPALTDVERRWLDGLPAIAARPAPEWARLNVPEWLLPKLAAVMADPATELAAMAAAAPVDLRVNTLKTDRKGALHRLKAAGFDAAPTPFAPDGLRLDRRAPVFAADLYKEGLVEVQDEGSQLAALLVAPPAGGRVVDFCAGAGGKTLALAAAMGNRGRILALDVSEPRLDELRKRLRRAGVGNTTVRRIESEADGFLRRHHASADRVLVDAPCSGSGTWRRNPDGKWSLTPERLGEYRQMQQRILDQAARLVKPGGELIYVTCSLFAEENRDQAEGFLTRHGDFAALPAHERLHRTGVALPGAGDGPYLSLTPARHGTDGFFVACFEKTATP